MTTPDEQRIAQELLRAMQQNRRVQIVGNSVQVQTDNAGLVNLGAGQPVEVRRQLTRDRRRRAREEVVASNLWAAFGRLKNDSSSGVVGEQRIFVGRNGGALESIYETTITPGLSIRAAHPNGLPGIIDADIDRPMGWQNHVLDFVFQSEAGGSWALYALVAGDTGIPTMMINIISLGTANQSYAFLSDQVVTLLKFTPRGVTELAEFPFRFWRLTGVSSGDTPIEELMVPLGSTFTQSSVFFQRLSSKAFQITEFSQEISLLPNPQNEGQARLFFGPAQYETTLYRNNDIASSASQTLEPSDFTFFGSNYPSIRGFTNQRRMQGVFMPGNKYDVNVELSEPGASWSRLNNRAALYFGRKGARNWNNPALPRWYFWIDGEILEIEAAQSLAISSFIDWTRTPKIRIASGANGSILERDVTINLDTLEVVADTFNPIEPGFSNDFLSFFGPDSVAMPDPTEQIDGFNLNPRPRLSGPTVIASSG